METSNLNKSVGVFIDGGYYAKINEGLAQQGPLRVNLTGLLQYIPKKICELDGIARRHMYITECHYYRGRYRAQDAKKKDLLYSEREFEDSLIENDVIFHYKHLRGRRGRLTRSCSPA